jgi:hypothetical protein
VRFAVLSPRPDELQRLTDARVERDLTRRCSRSFLEASTGRFGPPSAPAMRICGAKSTGIGGAYDLNTLRDSIRGMQRRIDALGHDVRNGVPVALSRYYGSFGDGSPGSGRAPALRFWCTRDGPSKAIARSSRELRPSS